jgi:hypothetical protein
MAVGRASMASRYRSASHPAELSGNAGQAGLDHAEPFVQLRQRRGIAPLVQSVRRRPAEVVRLKCPRIVSTDLDV